MESQQQQVYKHISLHQHADDQEELLSSTDVDDSSSMIGDDHHHHHHNEKQWHNVDLESSAQKQAKRTRTQTCVVLFRRYRWLVDTVLLLVNISLSLLLVRNFWEAAPGRTPWQVGGDFGGDGPKFATKVTKWEADTSFVPMNTSEFFEEKTVDRWRSLLPAGAGYGDSETFSTTSMTHQLHCLFMMGRVYAGVLNNKTDVLPHDYHHHFLHCIDYIRQGIMCSADVALEPHNPSDSDDLGAKDGGWNGHHVCKDYTQVIHYLEEQIVQGVRTVLPVDD